MPSRSRLLPSSRGATSPRYPSFVGAGRDFVALLPDGRTNEQIYAARAPPIGARRHRVRPLLSAKQTVSCLVLLRKAAPRLHRFRSAHRELFTLPRQVRRLERSGSLRNDKEPEMWHAIGDRSKTAAEHLAARANKPAGSDTHIVPLKRQPRPKRRHWPRLSIPCCRRCASLNCCTKSAAYRLLRRLHQSAHRRSL
jgi:hypothetical protein